MTNRSFASRTPLLAALALASALGACVKIDPVAIDRDGETDAPDADVPVVDAPTTDAPLPDAPADAPPADAPPADAPPADAPIPAVCPADLYVDGQGSVPTLAYPGVILEAGAAETFDGVWLAPERAAPAVTQTCNARFVTSPPSLPCTADARVRITNVSRGGTFTSVVGVPFEWLAAIAPDTEVRVVRVAANERAPAGTAGTLLVTRMADAKLLLMVTDDAREPSAEGIVVPNAEITVRPDVASPVCTAAPGGFCSYVFSQLALSLSTPEGPMRLLPGATADVHTSLSGDFHVLHRRYVRRGGDGVSCAFLMPDKFSFAVVRTN